MFALMNGDRKGGLPSPSRVLLSVMMAAVVWSAAYTAVFLGMAAVVGVLRPQDIDPGEGPAVISSTGLGVGFLSGALFDALASLVRPHGPRRALPRWGAAAAGALAASAWPLLTRVDDRMVMLLCPLGAVCAIVTSAIARSFERPATGPPPLP